MQDLQYILGIGFSASDITRTIFISFIFAMFARKKSNLWYLALIALGFDRVVWPIIGMASTGAELQTIYASLGAMVKTFTDDLGIYIVRYLGLFVMINSFIWVRLRVNPVAAKKTVPA